VGKCRGEDNLSNQNMKVVILHLLERVKELENRNVEDDSNLDNNHNILIL
jgi:hypothetical protein